MNLAKHYRLIGVNGDNLIDYFLCGGNSIEDSDCRINGGRCGVIEHLYGMSDFAAYRTNGEKRELISFTGTYDAVADSFKEDVLGSDKLSLSTKNEYLEILLNDKWVNDIEAGSLAAFKILTLELDFEAYQDEYGDQLEEDEEEFPGTFWEIAAESEPIYGHEESFNQLLSLQWDYSRNSSEANRELKKLILP